MIPKWVIELLDRHGVHYEHLHRPEGFTPEELETDEHGCRQCVAEVSVVVADGRFVELVYPANDWVDLEKVRELVLCSDLRFATDEELTESYPDCEPGAIPPLRMPPASDVVVDRWVDINTTIVFLAGSNRDAIRMPIHDWIEMVNPRAGLISQPVEVMLLRDRRRELEYEHRGFAQSSWNLSDAKVLCGFTSNSSRSFGLVAVGVGAMFVLSAFGGIGGSAGRSLWSGLVILPYAVGWIAGFAGGILSMGRVVQASRGSDVTVEVIENVYSTHIRRANGRAGTVSARTLLNC